MGWYSSNKDMLKASPIKGYRMRCYKYNFFVPVYDVPGYNLVYYGIVLYEGESENLYDIKIHDVDSKEFKSLSVDTMKMLLDDFGFSSFYNNGKHLFSSQDNMVVIDGRPLIKGKYVDHLCYGKVDVKNIDKTLAANYIQRHSTIISIMSRYPNAIRSFEDANKVRNAFTDIQEPLVSSNILNFDSEKQKIMDEISSIKTTIQTYEDGINRTAEMSAESLNALETEFGISLKL